LSQAENVLRVLPGSPYPLGATVRKEGINFSVFSAHATSVQLLLFDHYTQEAPTYTLTLDPQHNRTYYYWHCFIPGLQDGQMYAYRVHGPYRPESGLRFNGRKCLVDPYTRAVAYGDNWSRAEALSYHENCTSAIKSVAVDVQAYDWEGDHPLQRPLHETVLYETHVRSMTAHPSAGVSCPGTYVGITEKIPYLQTLGITAIELLPVQQFDEQEVYRRNPLTGERLKNYWGYAPVAYFAPHLGYTCKVEGRASVDEFRDMVKALHRGGIEVILDVVFNHTAESDDTGPWISFRGFENVAYYMLLPDKRKYANYTGTGNSVNCNHSIVRRMIRDCLRYWVQEMHVDGFRFDLASVLSRNEAGEPITDSPILWEIESDPVLAGTKLIAEAWDAAGLYQLGAFTGDRWAEWNGRFRDDIRRFMRGDEGLVRDFAWRLTGSFDIFSGKPSYSSQRSINYITCHDGFTLADLVSYNAKHNEGNGENNLDGTDANYSYNHGIEGPSEDPVIQRQRHIQMKNLLALLMVSRGTPMLLGGDEMARTQGGNNNAYCQDNPLSWYDWRILAQNDDLARFVRGLIALRRRHTTLSRDHVLGYRHWEEALYDGVEFHGILLNQPDWSHHSHSLAVHLCGNATDVGLYIITNAYVEPLTFELPPQYHWRRLMDTSLDSPDDLVEEEGAPLLTEATYTTQARSVVILIEDRSTRKLT
jgi:isoamylase